MGLDRAALLANKKIKARLLSFEKEIDDYRDALNTEGVWLFLSTLGCWGVTNQNLQFFAFIITIILFFNRIRLKLSDMRLFIIRVKEIEELITSVLRFSDFKKERLDDLAKIKKEKLSLFTHVKAVPIYLICYVFLLLSFLNLFFDFDLLSWLVVQSYGIG